MAAAVVCDNCGDGQTPAVRTCLRCEMSFCATHLKPHVENPRLRDHVLEAPIANLAERQCQTHRKELEFYCTVDSRLVCATCTIAGEHTGHRVVTLQKEQETRKNPRLRDHVVVAPMAGRQCQQHRQELILYCEQDESPVCTSCTIAREHRGHEVVPVENAQQTRQKALRREMTEREKKKTAAESQTQQLRGAYNRVQESLRGTRARISREFERRREQLRQEEREALKRVDEEDRSVLSRIRADIAYYEIRAHDLEQEINQLLAALAVQDPLTFLQDPLQKSLRKSSVSQEIQDDPAPVSRSLNLAKVISVCGVQTKLLPFLDGRSPTLDTNSAHKRLQISSDLRTATWSRHPQSGPDYPLRFDGWRQALCSQSFSSGQHYWEVDVGSSWSCDVGVAYGTIPRRGVGAECGLGGSDVSWCLRKYGDSFSVRHGGVETSLSVREPPRRVGVHLDWDAGLLSFYSADSMAPLHSFYKTFTQPLYPGLGVGLGVGWFGVLELVMSYYKVCDSVRIVGLSGAS